MRREEGAEPSRGLAVPAQRELRGAPAVEPVRPAQSPDPRAPGRRAGAAGKGPVHLQLELLRPALRQTAGSAGRPRGRRCAALSAQVPAKNFNLGLGWGRAATMLV